MIRDMTQNEDQQMLNEHDADKNGEPFGASINQQAYAENTKTKILKIETRTDFWNNPRPTNENPNFVSDYFASSRLHFIGSFRARYEAMMVSVGKNIGINPSILLHQYTTNNASAGAKRNNRVVVHIDMDAFFASIAVRDNLKLKGMPVAVCHAAGEVSSCTYEARKFGVRAGMFLRDARKLCPTLRNVDYDFQAYEKVSIQIYSLFYKLSSVIVEAVSVDEAYLDITNVISKPTASLNDNTQQQNDNIKLSLNSNQLVEDFIQDLRHQIFTQTGCTASAGIGPSKLVARLATKAAKPNGQFQVTSSQVIPYLDTLSIRDLPGIGWRTSQKFENDLKIKTVPQLRSLPLQRLQAIFGDKQGLVFYDLARAVDTRSVEPLKPRRSIGAELSWGVRFLTTEEDKVRTFISQVAAEVAIRVSAAGAYGTKVIYKLYKRIRGADASKYKHLGHGPCTTLTKSAKLPTRVFGEALKRALIETCLSLHFETRISHDDFRGIGVQVADLTFADLKFDHSMQQVPGTRRIDSFFKPTNKAPDLSELRAIKNREGAQLSREDKGKDKGNHSTVDRDDTVGARSSSDTTKGHGRPNINQASELEVVRTGLEDEIRPAEENYLAEKESSRKACNINPSDQSLNEIQPLRKEETTSNSQNQAEDVNECDERNLEKEIVIPDGWDRDVFLQLPPDIRSELLAENAQRRLNNAKHQGGQTTLTNQEEGLGVRRRDRKERDQETDGNVGKRKRLKGAAQVTITQIAELKTARQSGIDVLSATEFQTKGLRDAVELLDDLRGANGRRKLKIPTRNAATSNFDYDIYSQQHDIPSPPSLSSDSDDGNLGLSLEDVVNKIKEKEKEIEGMYEDESIVSYAPVLRKWMEKTNDDVRSAHVELLRGKLLELLKDGKLQRLTEELRIIRRFAVSDHCISGWVSPFNTLISQIQQECKYKFNFTLDVMEIEKSFYVK